MSQNQLIEIEDEIIYPESDGKPMADNTKQFDWITHIVYNLRTQFRNNPNVFIAGDLLWYPVESDNKNRHAPDAMVAFGRPRGHRGSYRQWLENDIAPQVVFEILSPANTEMEEKFQFYQNYQVEEYYLYDLVKGQLKGWLCGGGQLHPIVSMHGWKSKRLGIRFELIDKELYLYHPDDSPFTTHTEESNRASEAANRALIEKQRADTEAKAHQIEKQRANTEAKARQIEKQRADIEAKRAEMAETKLARLQALLAEKGISLNDEDIFLNGQ
ncbi:Uma2 family endonuclease [Candidatus Parabeggiatoa sp. HSG14]|uniref:Uma2 family endonuclease n=1 Tax=Candidatus Parabeggiatoa sp. HSG14 TaxID=3055593 RepID=UPI0025A7D003|nr:Uma2 family endonuclease [Thiotrichales bacterium HSG14]